MHNLEGAVGPAEAACMPRFVMLPQRGSTLPLPACRAFPPVRTTVSMLSAIRCFTAFKAGIFRALSWPAAAAAVAARDGCSAQGLAGLLIAGCRSSCAGIQPLARYHGRLVELNKRQHHHAHKSERQPKDMQNYGSLKHGTSTTARPKLETSTHVIVGSCS